MGSYYGDFGYAATVGLDLDEDLIPEIDCPEPGAGFVSSGVAGVGLEADQSTTEETQ